jgi:nicotinamide mononucleotide transporter
MNSVIRYIEENKFGALFMLSGIMLQIFSFYYTGSSYISLISGVTGIISVVLCAERRISFYTFGFIQLFTYIILCLQQNLYGEIVENIFYAVTMIYGIFIWIKSKDKNDNSKVVPKTLKLGNLTIIYIIGLLAILGFWIFLGTTNDTQPFMDSITTVPAIIAQILMILAYKEQWYFWLIIDIGSIFMWAIANDWNMVAQFIFWTINCLYGIKNWKYVY